MIFVIEFDLHNLLYYIYRGKYKYWYILSQSEQLLANEEAKWKSKLAIGKTAFINGVKGICNNIIGHGRQRKYTVLLDDGREVQLSKRSSWLQLLEYRYLLLMLCSCAAYCCTTIDNDASEISLSASDYYLLNEKEYRVSTMFILIIANVTFSYQ